MKSVLYQRGGCSSSPLLIVWPSSLVLPLGLFPFVVSKFTCGLEHVLIHRKLQHGKEINIRVLSPVNQTTSLITADYFPFKIPETVEFIIVTVVETLSNGLYIERNDEHTEILIVKTQITLDFVRSFIVRLVLTIDDFVFREELIDETLHHRSWTRGHWTTEEVSALVFLKQIEL